MFRARSPIGFLCALVAVELAGEEPSVAWSVEAGPLPLGVMWAPPIPAS